MCDSFISFLKFTTDFFIFWSSGPLIPWSSGPLVLWSFGPSKNWFLDATSISCRVTFFLHGLMNLKQNSQTFNALILRPIAIVARFYLKNKRNSLYDTRSLSPRKCSANILRTSSFQCIFISESTVAPTPLFLHLIRLLKPFSKSILQCKIE